MAEAAAGEISRLRRTSCFPAGWRGGSMVMRNTGDLELSLLAHYLSANHGPAVLL